MAEARKIGMFAPTKNGVPYEQMLELASTMGFRALELYPFDDLNTPDLGVAQRLADRAAELEMDICCLSMGANLAADDQAAQVERVKQYVRVAETAGAPYVHFTLFPMLQYNKLGVPLGKLVRRIAPAVKEICDFAGEHHVGCVLEGQGFYMNGIEPLERIVDSVDHPNLGIVADLGNLLCVDQMPEDFVGYFAPMIHHVHIKDMERRSCLDADAGEGWKRTRGGDYIRRTELGNGVIDLERNLRILAAAGYDGYFSIENVVIGREEKASQDLAYLDRLLEKVFGQKN